jgi:N-acyl-phosphatidylethanolamine-hydrolysing phospholipase D
MLKLNFVLVDGLTNLSSSNLNKHKHSGGPSASNLLRLTKRKATAMSKSTAKGDRPAHHANDSGTAFINPWPSAEKASYVELLQGSFPLGWYGTNLPSHERARDIKVVVPDWGEATLKERGLDREKCIVGTWLGHAGVLVELPIHGAEKVDCGKQSLWVVFDPIFSARAGPTQYTGPQRMKKSPCRVEDLPGCDVVVISHNHYDHLDMSSIKDISKRFPAVKFLLPLGNKSWLSSSGVAEGSIHEMDWWQKRDFKPADFGCTEGSDKALVRFTSVPAQHNSGRGVRDQGSTLWCGWVVEHLVKTEEANSTTRELKRKASIYHAGDTGYRRSPKSESVCPAFAEIGQKFGPLDLSFVPIWRGGSLGFFSSLGLRLSHEDIPATFHASPADAIEIHKEVKSRNTIGVHFGTFIGSENESYEAIIEYDEAREKAGVLHLADVDAVAEFGRAGVLDIGGSWAVELAS